MCPAQISALVKLEVLYLKGNTLTGPIPSEISTLTKLDELDLEMNRLTGTVPAQISALVQLKYLYLANTQIEPTICRVDAKSSAAVQKLIKNCASGS